MRLRTKVTLFFGLIASVATVTLTVVTYLYARESLIDQRFEVARQQAVLNASRIRDELRASTTLFCEGFPDENIRIESEGYALIRLANGATCTTNNLFSEEVVPPDLRDAVQRGASGIQQFTFRDQSYIGVGVHIAEVDADYFQAFQLGSTARTLNAILLALLIGSAATVLLATAKATPISTASPTRSTRWPTRCRRASSARLASPATSATSCAPRSPRWPRPPR
jgi:hypothetical protein